MGEKYKSNQTRFQKALTGSFDDIDVFTNINEIKRLADDIEVLDVVNPTSAVYGKVAELLCRVKALKEFEVLSIAETFHKNVN